MNINRKHHSHDDDFVDYVVEYCDMLTENGDNEANGNGYDGHGWCFCFGSSNGHGWGSGTGICDCRHYFTRQTI